MIRRIFLSIALAIAVAAPAISLAADKAESANPGKPTLDVVMYSTATCPYCEKARQWFTSHKVAWDERDVETSEAARKQWQEWVRSGRRSSSSTASALPDSWKLRSKPRSRNIAEGFGSIVYASPRDPDRAAKTLFDQSGETSWHRCSRR